MNKHYITGKQVWVKLSTGLFEKGTIVQRIDANKKIKCRINTCQQIIQVQLDQIYELNNQKTSYSDMCEMNILNQPQIFFNLKRRFQKDQIFTKIGHILIIMNPYKNIQHMFSCKKSRQIIQILVKNGQNSKKQEPHIFLFAGTVFKNMKTNLKPQIVIISGQSGAGKTENTKYSLKFLIEMTSQTQKHKIQTSIDEKILQCNPILEAFGNSKTIKNNNSSRFGKYIKLFFDDQKIVGANIKTYLLEKSRICSVHSKQKNYHIFYILLASNFRSQINLKLEQKYDYLQQGDHSYKYAETNQQQISQKITKALISIGFNKQQIQKIWKTLGVILLLGNVKFYDKKNEKTSEQYGQIKNPQIIERINLILNIQSNTLNNLLTMKYLRTNNNVLEVKNNKKQCVFNRNVLSKALYNQLFQKIVEKINQNLGPKENYKNTIGILDIFGFQKLDINSLEQLCINYTNEKLQKLYIKYVFENQILELQKDGLRQRIIPLKYVDNKEIVDLIQKRKGLSIFSIIDDKTSLNSAKNQDIVTEMKRIKNNFLKVNPNNTADKLVFMISHTQSNVVYNANEFVEKNQDNITKQIEQFTQKILDKLKDQSKKKTLISKFDKEIKSLIQQLQISDMHFIKCIKPNEQKKKNKIDQFYLLQQIEYLGLLETIKVRKSGFSLRMEFKAFNKIYLPLLHFTPDIKNNKDLSLYIIRRIIHLKLSVKQEQKLFVCGNQKIYINSDISHTLNMKLSNQNRSANKIQNQVRKYFQRKLIQKNIKKLIAKSKVFKKWFSKINNVISKNLYKNFFKMLKQYKTTDNKYHKKYQISTISLSTTTRFSPTNKRQTPIVISSKKLINSNTLHQKFYLKFIRVLPFIQKQKIFISFAKLKCFFMEKILNLNSKRLLKETQIIRRRRITFIQQIQKHVIISDSIPIQKYIENKIFKNIFNVSQNSSQSEIRQRSSSEIIEKDQFYMALSKDSEFNIQKLKSDLLWKILNFDYLEHLQNNMRERTNLFGLKKSVMKILQHKAKPLNKSLLILKEEDQQKSKILFSHLQKLIASDQIEDRIQIVIILIQFLQNSSQDIKHQFMIQMFKQMNIKSQLIRIRVLELMSVYIHVFTPDDEYILTSLNLFYQRIEKQTISKKQNQYISYLFLRFLNKLEQIIAPQSKISYLPAKYQIAGLMNKRTLALPIFLAGGQQIVIEIENYQTLDSIKQKILHEVGIDTKRIKKEYFGFVQIMNFEKQIVQRPLAQKKNIWDLLSTWEIIKSKFEKNNINGPVFIIMLKIIYPYQCTIDDKESIQLYYMQCQYDYFVGRLTLDVAGIIQASSIIKILNLSNDILKRSKVQYKKKQIEIATFIPNWVLNLNKLQEMLPKILARQNQLKNLDLNSTILKFLLLKVCNSHPLCMAFSIPTQQSVKLFLRPKNLFIVNQSIIQQSIPTSLIRNWQFNDEIFKLNLKTKLQDPKMKCVSLRTKYGKIISQFLIQNQKLTKQSYSF